MALPGTLNPATPAGTASPSGGYQQLRNIKQIISDVLGWPTDPTAITAPAFTMTAGGVLTVAQSQFNTKGIAPALGAITTDNPALNATAEWNDSGVTFNAIKANITDTASAAASRLLALQVGAADKFVVTKAGAVTVGSWTATAVASQYGGTGQNFSASTGVPLVNSGTFSAQALTNGQLLIGSTGTVPSAATLTAANNILVTNGAGSITVGSRDDFVVKSADVTINNDDTVNNDADLLFAMAAGDVYQVDLILFVTSTLSADFQCGFAFPTGCLISFGQFLNATVLTDQTSTLTVNFSATGLMGVHIRAIVNNPDNAGNLTFQWAQGSANGSNTTLHQWSVMRHLKLSP